MNDEKLSLGARIKNRRRELGLSVDELAERIHKNRATVYRYEADYIENYPLSVIHDLSRALSVSPAYFMGWLDKTDDSTIISATKRVPIIGDTAAGAPITAERVYDEYVELPADGKRYDAAVHITGDSMEPTYRLGDLALLRYQPDVENGEAAVICIDDTVTLKRVYHVKGGLMLQSDNPKYEPMLITEADCESIHLVGKVVGFVHWEE